MKQEYDVKFIWNSLSDFWSSFDDKEVPEQLWRGYIFVINNLYYQLYQLDLSKSIETVPHEWISDWEYFSFTDSTAIDESDTGYPSYSGYPYRYHLPSGVKNVNQLRESPREVVRLPDYTSCGSDGIMVTPEGYDRYLGESGVYAPESMIVWDDTYIFDKGINVDTVILEPHKDYLVDEDTKSIHFKEKPYVDMWSHQSIRDINIVYANFGSLIDYPGPDTLAYKRQVQGLWYAYWMGSTISNIERGLTILNNLPFIEEDGTVERVEHSASSVKIGDTVYQMPRSVTETVRPGCVITTVSPDGSVVMSYNPVTMDMSEANTYTLRIENPDNPLAPYLTDVTFDVAADCIKYGNTTRLVPQNYNYFEESYRHICTEVEIPQEDRSTVHGTLIIGLTEDQASLYRDGTTILRVDRSPDSIVLGDIIISRFEPDVIARLHEGDVISEVNRTSSIITVSGKEYTYEGESPLKVSLGDYVNKFDVLTDAVHVYDYINYPGWNTSYLGTEEDAIESCERSGGAYFDTKSHWDNGGTFDAIYYGLCIQSAFMQYFTFLVQLDSDAWFSSKEDQNVLIAFLKAVKPAYTDFIFQFTINFKDEVICYDREVLMDWEERRTDYAEPDLWNFDDGYRMPVFDESSRFDTTDLFDGSFDLSMTFKDTVLWDDEFNGFIFDDEAVQYFDTYTALTLDSDLYGDFFTIEWSRPVKPDRHNTLIRGESFIIDVSLYTDGELVDYPVEDMYADALFENELRKSLKIEHGDMPGKYILTSDMDTWTIPGYYFKVNIGVYDNRGSISKLVASFNDIFYIEDSATDLSDERIHRD